LVGAAASFAACSLAIALLATRRALSVALLAPREAAEFAAAGGLSSGDATCRSNWLKLRLMTSLAENAETARSGVPEPERRRRVGPHPVSAEHRLNRADSGHLPKCPPECQTECSGCQAKERDTRNWCRRPCPACPGVLQPASPDSASPPCAACRSTSRSLWRNSGWLQISRHQIFRPDFVP
jgi:hypothetical protein